MRTYKDVVKARQELFSIQREFLRDSGWGYSCDFPDSVWRWSKTLDDGRVLAMSGDDAYHIQSVIDRTAELRELLSRYGVGLKPEGDCRNCGRRRQITGELCPIALMDECQPIGDKWTFVHWIPEIGKSVLASEPLDITGGVGS